MAITAEPHPVNPGGPSLSVSQHTRKGSALRAFFNLPFRRKASPAAGEGALRRSQTEAPRPSSGQSSLFGLPFRRKTHPPSGKEPLRRSQTEGPRPSAGECYPEGHLSPSQSDPGVTNPGRPWEGQSTPEMHSPRPSATHFKHGPFRRSAADNTEEPHTAGEAPLPPGLRSPKHFVSAFKHGGPFSRSSTESAVQQKAAAPVLKRRRINNVEVLYFTFDEPPVV